MEAIVLVMCRCFGHNAAALATFARRKQTIIQRNLEDVFIFLDLLVFSPKSF